MKCEKRNNDITLRSMRATDIVATDGGDGNLREGIVGESQDDIRFPRSRVTNHQEFVHLETAIRKRSAANDIR